MKKKTKILIDTYALRRSGTDKLIADIHIKCELESKEDLELAVQRIADMPLFLVNTQTEMTDAILEELMIERGERGQLADDLKIYEIVVQRKNERIARLEAELAAWQSQEA